ncbi:TIGR04255 family protein [Pseudomonas sp. BN505]|nr:TIGR04255 family protein [Pseudomonas sp. BN605]MDH4859567.1 TIGR04255 family protein [Pseudomonas sp. BN505]
MSTGMFKPVHGAHAVVETVFFFEFAAPILSDEAIEGSLPAAYADILDRVDKTGSIEVSFDAATRLSSQREIFTYTFSNGGDEESEAPEWAVRIIDGIQISIHCTAYTRWDAVSKQAFQFLDKLAMHAENALDLRSLGFKVVDQFRYEPSEGPYDLRQLCDPTSSYLARKNFESGERWHNNSGWFWAHPNGKQILNHLNVNSSAVAVQYKAPHTYVTIDHVQVLRREEEGYALLSSVDADQFSRVVHEFFEPLHDQNKLVINDLLTEDACRRLSLVVGGKQ